MFINSWGNSYKSCLLLIITLCFTCGENNTFSSIKMSQNIMNMVAWEIFFIFFLSLLTALILQSSPILARIYITFLKNYCILKLKGFQFQIWSSVKRLVKYLLSKTNFSTFLHISCSSFRLKLCQRSKSYKNCQTNQIWRGLGKVGRKKSNL